MHLFDELKQDGIKMPTLILILTISSATSSFPYQPSTLCGTLPPFLLWVLLKPEAERDKVAGPPNLPEGEVILLMLKSRLTGYPLDLFPSNEPFRFVLYPAFAPPIGGRAGISSP